jgi:hypothetical protein
LPYRIINRKVDEEYQKLFFSFEVSGIMWNSRKGRAWA